MNGWGRLTGRGIEEEEKEAYEDDEPHRSENNMAQPTRMIAKGLSLLALALLWSCSGPKAPETTSETMGAVEAYGRFVEIRRAKPVDFEALIELYDFHLAPYVRDASERHGVDLEPTIRAALAQGRAGRDVHAVAQVAEKTIQRAFILTFTKDLAAIEGVLQDPERIARIREAAQVLRSVAERRSRWAGKGSEYPDLFDAAWTRLFEAAGRKDRAAAAEAKDQLQALTIKGIVLSVFYELEGLEEARGKDEDKVAEKRVEAQIYHRNIARTHEKRNALGAATVAGALAGPAEAIDVDLVRRVLRSDFAGELTDIDPKRLGLAP